MVTYVCNYIRDKKWFVSWIALCVAMAINTKYAWSLTNIQGRYSPPSFLQKHTHTACSSCHIVDCAKICLYPLESMEQSTQSPVAYTRHCPIRLMWTITSDNHFYIHKGCASLSARDCTRWNPFRQNSMLSLSQMTFTHNSGWSSWLQRLVAIATLQSMLTLPWWGGVSKNSWAHWEHHNRWISVQAFNSELSHCTVGRTEGVSWHPNTNVRADCIHSCSRHTQLLLSIL